MAPDSSRSIGLRSLVASLVVVGLLVPALVTMAPARAAVETFSESFRGATLASPADWVASNGSGGTGFDGVNHPGEPACLTGLAFGQAISVDSGSIVGCPHGAGRNAPGSLDTPGSGVLRLTDNRFMQSAMVLYNRPQRVSDGLDITFAFAMHSGVVCPAASCGYDVPGADGFVFFIKDAANSNDAAGTGGGALGYALERSVSASRGIRGGLLGVGFDFYGAFSIQNTAGLGPARSCPAPGPSVTFDSGNNSREAATDRVVLRGPDLSGVGDSADGSCGYGYLGRSVDPVDFGRVNPGASTRRLALSPPSREDAARRARVVIDKPGAGARVKVYVWSDGAAQPVTPVLDVAQPAELQGVAEFKFGFSAGTGWATLVNEIWDLQIVLADPEVQAIQAAAAAASIPSGPSLACVPDPVSPGQDVTCTITSGPAGGDILWRATTRDRLIGSMGVTMDDAGVAVFTFRAPPDASGSVLDVELVDWGVSAQVAVVGGPVPTRVDAGSGVPRSAQMFLVLLLAGLGGLGALRPQRQARAS